ncbi:MAG TPA: peptide chain release factor N(5)-glutamine methyltransferase [Campylobacterales bacterium]|nr:peptide chain release factor N(5)-glutamine methyltransferase [Campylobacterales bacterium]
MRLKEAIKIAKLELSKIESAAKETLWLYSKYSGKSVAGLLANDEIEINDEVFDNFLKKRKSDIPFEYIVNEAGFYGHSFFVDERCLIPRPETELLIDAALGIIVKLGASSVLDICTGSGAIACTLKKESPSLRVAASDISPKALEVAKINANNLCVDIDFFLSDLFVNIKDNSFDILTANPPYIQNSYKPKANVLHEPHNALFGGESGSEIVEAAIDGFLKREFKAFICEIGFDQREKLSQKLSGQKNIKYDFYKDYAGLDRGFWIIKESF